MSTSARPASGRGIAIPHPRNPIVLRVPAPAVAVAYLAKPVEYEALDGAPVHTLFTLVSRSMRVHLHLLAVLAAALGDPEVQRLILARAGAAELIDALDRVETALELRRAARARGEGVTLLLAALTLLVAGGLAALGLAAGRRWRSPSPPPPGWPAARWASSLRWAPSPRAASSASRSPGRRRSRSASGSNPLSAFFLVALFALAIPAVLYGATYMRPHLGRRGFGGFLFFQNGLIAAMALVFSARQAVLFLVAWEVMAISSFLLVAFEHDDAEVRSAGLVYLVASHLGTAFLFALFVLLGREAGSFDFEAFAALPVSLTTPAAMLFGLALIGFGTKAGLVPLHVWLPEAHPAAQPLSALLSGVVDQDRTLRDHSRAALARARAGGVRPGPGRRGAGGGGGRDHARPRPARPEAHPRLLERGERRHHRARHRSRRGGLRTRAGDGGGPGVGRALLHVWNHAFMKGLAFMAAGAVAHAAHGRDIERMGGLLARLPRTASLLLLGLAALAALPPLNGFSSEWLVYLSLLRSAVGLPGGASILAWAAVATLALVGGVAVIAFARLGGVALLGAPRSPEAAAAHEPGAGLWGPLAALAAVCVGLGLFPDLALRLAGPALAQVNRASPPRPPCSSPRPCTPWRYRRASPWRRWSSPPSA